jgi:hypothetical protein
MANSNGWGDGAANNAIGWGQGANNAIGWGDLHAKSWAGATDIVGLTTDPDAQAFITAAAITDPTQQLAIDNLVKGLKSDNIWTKMKAIYPFVGGTASTHKWNLKDPRDLDAAFRLVFNGGWTHSSNGATPNGTNGYADTKLQPLSVLAQNNSHLSYYSRTNQANGNFIEIGTESPDFLLWYKAFNLTRGNVDGSMDYTPTVASTQGFLLASKYSTSQGLMQYNGAQQLKTGVSGNTRGAKNIYLAALNSTGAAYYSSKQVAFSSIGDGLTDTEAANLYTRVQAYQTALSRQV